VKVTGISEFEHALSLNILETCRMARADGTAAMSMACLQQCVPSPSALLPGAPRGANAQYYYAQLFAAVARRICKGYFKITEGGGA